MSVTRKIAQVVRPDVRHEADDMDIRQYVQIKKVKFVHPAGFGVTIISPFDQEFLHRNLIVWSHFEQV